MEEKIKTQLAQYCALIEAETDVLAIMANTSAFIMETLSDLNWAGFYILKGTELILGPFQGKPACYRIQQGRGVCGHCVANRKSIIVPDVHAFPGHIACDATSKSELVVPIVHNDAVFGVIDLDSADYDRFTDNDRIFLEAVAAIFASKIA